MNLKLKLLEDLKKYNSKKGLKDIEDSISKRDLDHLVVKEKENYRIELWDRVTPINGVPPEAILKDKYPVGEVYLIYIDGKLHTLQKFDPSEPGFKPFTKESAKKHADDIVDRAAKARVHKRVYDDILIELLKE